MFACGFLNINLLDQILLEFAFVYLNRCVERDGTIFDFKYLHI